MAFCIFISANVNSGSPVSFFDNDLAYELQRSGVNLTPPTVSSWADIPVPPEKDKNKQEKEVTSWADVTAQKSVSWHDVSKSENDMSKQDNDVSKIEDGVRDNKLASVVQEQLSLNSLDDKLIKKRLTREASRIKEKDLATSLVSPRAPVLSTQQLDNIDLGW